MVQFKKLKRLPLRLLPLLLLGNVLKASATGLDLPTCDNSSDKDGATPANEGGVCTSTVNNTKQNVNFCIDNTNMKIYKTDDTNNKCEVETLTDGTTYYIYNCDGITCEAYSAQNSNTEKTYVIYKNADDDKVEKVEEATTTDLYNPNDTGILLIYVDGAYKLVGNNGYYLNPDTTDTTAPLIQCTVTDNVPTYSPISKTEVTASTAYYVDGSKFNNDSKYTQLISCTVSSGNISGCLSSQSEGYYINGGDKTKLIYCDSDKICETKAMANGYYINSGADNTTNKLIRCKDEGCSTVAKTVDYYVDASNIVTGQTNQYSKLIKCTTDGTCSNSDTLTENDNGYYVDELYNNGSGNYSHLIVCTTGLCESKSVTEGYFLNKATGTDEKPLISCSNGSCVKKDGVEGFYLNSGNTSSGTDSSGNAIIIYNGIINCSKSQVSDPLTCSPVDNLKDGFYLDASNINEADGVVTYKGIINCIKNDDNSISCDKENSVADGYYMNGDKETTTDADGDERKYSGLIKCIVNNGATTSCELKTPNSAYYRVAVVDASNPLNDALFKCEMPYGGQSNICTLVTGEANTGFYVNGSTNHLIDCNKNSNKCVDKEITENDTGYYLDAGLSKNLILCSGSSGSFTCTTSQSTNVDSVKHYLDADTKRVITCNSENCFLEDSDVKGYFLNDSTLTSSTKHVISCGNSQTTSQCEELSDTDISSVTTIGNVKYFGEKASLCLTENCGSVEEITDASDNVYKTLEISATNDFPGVTLSDNEKKKIPVKISKNGSAIMMTDAKLPVCGSDVTTNTACTNNDTSGQYCIDNTNKIHIVITAENGTKSKCILAKNGDIYYFNKNGMIVDEPSLDGTETSKQVNVIAYQCSFDSTTDSLNSCELAKGYTKINSTSPKYIYCSGWKDEGCIVSNSLTACNNDATGNGKLGLIGSNPGICTTSNFEIPTSDSTIIAFKFAETSEIYGKIEDEIITLSLSSDKALIINLSPSSNKYYINYNDNGDDEEIITCNGTSCTTGPSKTGYYLDAGYETTTASTHSKLIECPKDGASCTSIAPNDGYYIDAMTSANIIYCITNNGKMECTSSPHETTGTNQKHYLGGAGTSKRVITCTANGCFEEDSAIKGYFQNSGASSTTKHIISCDGTECQELTDSQLTTTKIGMVKYDTGISLCLDNSCTTTASIPKSDYDKIYQTLTVEVSSFPGADAGEISVKVGTDGTAILLEEMTGLPECTATSNTEACFTDAKDGQYCIVKTNDNISGIKRTDIDGDTITCTDITGADVVTDASTDPKIVISASGTHVIFFNSDGYLLETPAASSDPILNVVAYQCTFGDSPFNVSSCQRIKGYAIDGNNIIQCSGLKREGCTVTTKDSTASTCSSGEGTILGDTTGICFGTAKISLSSTEDDHKDYVAFEAADFNPYYGIVEKKIAFLHLTDNASLVVESDDSTAIKAGYHRNVATTTGTDKREKALIYCTTESELDSCTSLDAFSGYYLNAGSDTTSLPLLKCSKDDGCIATTTKVSTDTCAIGAINSDKTLYIDCDESNPISIQIAIDNSDNAKVTYETIESSDSTPAFPDTETSKKYPIKIRPDGSAILLEDISLPVCTSGTLPATDALCQDNALNGQHCIKEGIIYVSTVNGSNVSCSKMEINDDNIKYFTKDGLNVELTNASTPDMAYQCTKDDNDNVSCILAKGITSVTTDGIVYCNGWIDETCQSVATASISDCVDGNNGVYGTVTVDSTTTKGLCFSTTSVVALPSDDDTFKTVQMSFEFSDTSPIFGQMSGSVPVLTLTSSSALINSDYKVTKNSETYFINYNSNGSDTKEIIKCDSTGCVAEASKVGYYLNSGYENSNKFYQLISCSEVDKVCTSISITSSPSINDGYYVNSGTDHLIQCTSGECTDNPVNADNIGYYMDAGSDANIILCSQKSGSSNEFSCVSNSHHNSADTNDINLKHYLDATSKRVITCNIYKCFLEDPAIKGYFINDGADTTSTKHIISCGDSSKSVPCTEIDDSSDTQIIGSIKYASSAANLCVTSECNQVIPADTNDVYVSLKIDNDNKFPGAEAGEISVKIGTDGTAILLEEMTGLQECTAETNSEICFDGAKNGEFCLAKDNGIINIKKSVITDENTSSGTCNNITNEDINSEVTISDAGAYLIFVNAEGEIINAPTTSTLNVVAYQCTFIGESSPFTIKSCQRVKGYVIDGDNIIQCSGWRREGCTVTAKDNTSTCTGEGTLSTDGSTVCFDSSTFPLNSETTNYKKYVAFEAADYNSIYGLVEKEVTFLHLNKISDTFSSVLVTDSIDAITPGYHLNVAVSDALPKALIYCKNPDNTSDPIICTSLDAFHGYYLNDGSDSSNQILTCGGSNAGCVATSITATSCDAAGILIKNNDYISLCLEKDTTSDDKKPVISKNENGNPSYETLEIVTANDFPGTTANSKNPIKIRPDGSAILLEDSSLPLCSSTTDSAVCITNAPDGQHCYSKDATTGTITIYKNTNSEGNTSCNAITGNDGVTSSILYFDSDYKLMENEPSLEDTETSKQVDAIAYQCTYSSDSSYTVSSCELAKGYTKIDTTTNNNVFIYCSGWKGEGCIVSNSVNDCSTEVNITIDNARLGYINDKLNICTTFDFQIPDDNTTTTDITIQLSNTSEIYGKLKDEIITLSASKNQVLVVSNSATTTDKYFINYNDDNEDEEIIKCNNKNGCSPMASQPGYFLDGSYKTTTEGTHTRLIECTKTGESCISIDPNEGYYIDAMTSSKIIQCLLNGTNKECTTIDHSGDDTTPTHYLGGNSSVITCITSGCFLEDSTIKGYFQNSGSASTTKHIISCNGIECKELTDSELTTTKIGMVKYDTGISLCLDDDCTTTALIPKGDNDKIYQTLIVEEGSFPGADAGEISIKVGTDGTAILLEEMTGLPECTAETNSEVCFDGAKNGDFCLAKDNGIITIKKTIITDEDTSSGTCNNITNEDINSEVTISTADAYLIFVNAEGEIINAPTTSTFNVVAYQCTFIGESSPFTIKSCQRVKGYVIDSNNIIQCSGWKREGCTVTTKDSTSSTCSSGEGTILGDTTGICFDTDKISLSSTENDHKDYVAFEAADYNLYYGIVEKKIAFLHLTDNASLVVESDDSTAIKAGYHRNVATTTSDDKREKALIYCTTEGELDSCTSLDAFSGYYLNAGSDTTSLSLLKCSKTNGCIASETQASGDDCDIGAVNSNKKLSIDCADSPNSIELAIDNSGNAKVTYETIENSSDTPAFPDTETGKKYPIKIRPDGSAILLEDNTIPVCTNASNDDPCFANAVSGQHCYKNDPDTQILTIYKNTDENKCSIITGEVGILTMYFNKSGDLIDLSDTEVSITSAEMAYQCTFTSDSLESCIPAKGYTTIDNENEKYYYCNGWIDETCQSIDTASIAACADGNNGVYGIISTTNGLCFTSTDVVALPTTNDKSIRMAFEFSKTSSVYGQMVGTISVLTLTNNSALIQSDYTTNDDEYFINYNNKATDTTKEGGKSELITCKLEGTDTTCSSGVSNTGYYFDAGYDEIETSTNENNEKVTEIVHTRLISCKDNNCKSLEITSDNIGYYVDAIGMTSASGTEKAKYNNLIKCNEKKNNEIIGYSCDNISSISEGYYLNAIANAENGLNESLIKCTSSSECTIENANPNDIYLNNDDDNGLIQCYIETPNSSSEENQNNTPANTEIGVCRGFAGTGTADIPAYYLNAAQTALTDAIITCTEANTCGYETNSGVVEKNAVFFNANLKGTTNGLDDTNIVSNPNRNDNNQLIVCGEADCQKILVEIAENGHDLYYVNAGTYKKKIDENDDNASEHYLIKCTYSSSGTVCTADVNVLPSVEKYYINGNYGEDNSYVIKCKENDKCTINTPTNNVESGDVEFYINGAANGFTEAVIKVSFTAKNSGDENISRKRETGDTQQENENMNNVQTETETIVVASCEVKNVNKNDIFIDASGDKKLIQCYETTSPDGECVSKDSRSGYFVNADPDLSTSDYTHDLIICDTDKCEYVDGDENKVFINGNYLVTDSNENGDDTNQLIICYEDNNNKICKGKDSKASAEKIVEYYANSGTNEQNKPLITCTYEESNHIVACSIGTVILNDGIKNVYLNSNFKLEESDRTDTENRLLICNSSECVPTSGAPANGEVDYYVNSGTVDTTTKLKDTLISCGASKCEVIDASLKVTGDVTELFYINANYNKYEDNDTKYCLIKCSTSDGCVLYDSTPTENAEYYVHGGASGYAEAIIKVTPPSTEETIQGRKRKQEIFKNEETSTEYSMDYDEEVTSEVIDDIFSNDKIFSLKEKMNDGLSGASEEVTDDIEIVNVPEEVLDDVNISSASSKVTCELIPGNDYDIYINAFNNKLIQCSSNACTSLTTESLLGTSDIPTYYVNAESKSTNKNPIIECVGGTNLCSFNTEVNEFDIYINGNLLNDNNQKGENNKPLIICESSTKCETQNSTVEDGKNLYYKNAGIYTDSDNNFRALIKCSNSESTVSCESLLVKVSTNSSPTNVYFINGNYINDKDHYLIECSSSTECSMYPNTLPSEERTEHYVNGDIKNSESSDLLTGAVIECVITKNGNNITVNCNEKQTINEYEIYINSATETLIQCSTANGCISINSSSNPNGIFGTPSIPTYFVNADSTVKNSSGRIIMCNGTKCTTESEEGEKPLGSEENIFFNGNLKDQTNNPNGESDKYLIICKSDKCETVSVDVEEGNTKYYVNSGDYIDNDSKKNKLIKCSNSQDTITCSSYLVEVSTGTPQNVYFINGNYVNGNYLIECTSEVVCLPYGSNRNPTITDVEHYVHGATNGLTDAILRVEFGTTELNNKKRSVDNAVPSLINGVDKYIYINSANNHIIQCQSDKCIPIPNTGSNEKPNYYLNAGLVNSDENTKIVSTNDNYENLIIKCTQTENCKLINGNEFDVFINGNYESDTENQLIICIGGSGECQLSEIDLSEVTNPKTNYYKNAGKYLDGENNDRVNPLILCSYDESGTKTTCKPEPVVMGSGQPNDVFYINGNYGADAPSDLMKYLIHCTATDRCITYSKTDATADTDEYYVHGGQIAFDNAIIKCSIAAVADDKITSVCKFADSPEPSENFMYINSSDGNLIQCSKTGDVESCNAFKGVVGSTSIPAYYVNGSGESADDKYNKLLIECKGNGKCIEFGGDDLKNNVYINSNYNYISQNEGNESNESNEANQNQNQVQSINPNPNGDNENRLIICSEGKDNSNNAIGICKTEQINVEVGNNYYVNGGSTNLASYVNILIKCSSSGPCTLINGANNNVYLNGNFKKDSSTTETDEENQLIICSDKFTDEKCKLKSSSLTEGYEYYLNAGKYINADNNYLLIKCKYDTSTICEPQVVTLGKGSTQEVYYINGNYVNDNKYTIHCTDLNNCSLYSNSRSISNSIEYYVHGDPDSQSGFNYAVIKCEINDDGIVDSDTGCAFATSTEGSIYINSSDNNLIQCSKDENDNESCNAFNGVLGINTEPAYYVNGDPPASTTDYNDLLIKCIGSGKCSLFNGSDKSVYINSNFRDTSIEYTTDNPDPIPNGDIENRIIICSENNNKKECTVGKVEVDDGKNVYYVNGGAINSKSSSYTNLLIKCSSTVTSKCTLESSNEDNIYLNGNVNIDSLPLINCNDKECTGIEIKEDGYYVNSGESTGAPLTYTLIKCEVDGTCEEEPVEGVDGETVTEVFYLNKNYGENDPINYLIKCNVTDGCVPYGTAKPKEDTVEHYVHGAQTNLDNAVIKVSFERITNTPSKRALNLETTITFESASINDIYINSFNEQLIQCYKDDNSKEGCASYKSEAEENKPLYYVNAEKKSTESETYEKLLIKCDAKCQAANGAVNNVYLNGNLKSDENANGDTDNQLIICNDKKCSAFENSASTDSEYYVNSGAYNAIPLVDTLIECADNSGVKCVTKDISEKIDGTDIKELFFINKNSDKDTQNYVIKCNKVKGCKPYSTGLTVGNEYFINGGNKTKEDTVIQCKFTDNVADCKTDKATTGAEDKQIYLNAANKKQIIRCTTDGCKAVDSAPTENRSEFYMNGDDHVASENGNNGGAEGEENTGVKVNSLIKCSKANSCEVLEIGDEEANKVYRNANFLENADTINQLIKCSKGTCELSVSKATDQLPEYYFNADDTYKDLLKEDVIECINKDSKITCTPITSKPNYVYVNSDFSDDNTNPVIACSAEKGCIELGSGGDENSFVYFVNAGSHSENPLDDTLIECSSGCNVISALNNEYYINALDPSQIIYCTEKKGCTTKKSNATKEKKEIYLNASDLKKNTEENAHANDLIICTNTDNKIECVASNGDENGIYVNSGTPGEIIQCNKDQSCQKVSMVRDTKDESPYYFINSDPLSKEDPPLINDLIKCRSVKGRVSCDVVNGNDGDVYLNGNVLNDSDNLPLIKCTSKDGCITSPSGVDETSPPEFYINSGSYQANRLNDTLIECTYENEQAGCAITIANENDIYVNYADNKNEHPLIQCVKSGCKVFDSNADEDNKEYYKNAGDSGEPDLVYDMIECSMTNNKKTCVEIKDVNPGIYLNSNYAERGDKHQIIECNKDSGCQGHQTSQDKTVEYYVNAEATGLANAIIYCYNKKCEKQTPTEIPTFYVGKDKELNGLIECTGDSLAAAKCTLTPAFTSQGYYLNGGYNKAINQTIICDSEEGCTSLKVNLGYYVNAGDAEKQIIKCENENQECTAENVKCPTSDETAKSGNYCYSNGQLKFYPAGNSTAVLASKSDDFYTYATIPSNGFPGIKKDISTLFKVSYYYINRFFQNGVVVIDKNGKLLSSLDSEQSDTNLYDCNESTKICTLRPSCTPYTYMYDTENGKALFCNEYERLKYAEFNGYVIDGNRAIGNLHPYLIYCEQNGKKCVTGRAKTTSYYENSGYDSSTNALIACANNNCVTTTAEVGYYVGHDGAGIIQCTSANACIYSKGKGDVRYLNAGANKSSHAIINCSRKGSTTVCKTEKGRENYYLTHVSNRLIYCSSSTSCEEITPSATYYNNAVSTGNGDGLIQCEESGATIQCSIKSSKIGFYLSAFSNKLISCSHGGSKCVTKSFDNGYFHEPIKRDPAKTNNSARSDEESILHESLNNNTLEDIDSQGEEEKVVNVSRNEDEVYGIIHCVAGKCKSLSPEELANIPICEFNNNKCYITLEYSMMKSSTTSLAAGNICTNSDRSVFYFATDTIVVKPNVIAGVTSTYVYTTTNSNCLEVNDSYNDMYFTVGSNIYLLDEGSVMQFYDPGYFFINTATNTLVTDNDIEAYNDENVKLYHCNGSSCRIVSKPTTLTYFTDVNKRIMKYNVQSESYSFAYEKDIICIFSNNKCTPNADLNGREFCITYKGELALVCSDIKNRETGECFKSSSISNKIYGISQYLYAMTSNQANRIQESGYYMVNLSTNTTVQNINVKGRNNNLVLYGCVLNNCKEYEPESNTYYYDERAKMMYRYENGVWRSPKTSGYALVSVDPNTKYIYSFNMQQDFITLGDPVDSGYHYTIDNEMYQCTKNAENGECHTIDDTDYYFTEEGGIYYCVYDSENREPTECTQQICNNGQYYYINEKYYRCESGSILTPVRSRHCSMTEEVVMNFPIALTTEYPENVKRAMEDIQKNNNSTGIVTRRSKNFLNAVSGIFTNCTYDVEETKSTFDLVCINNYVQVDKKSNELKICSVEQKGYIECIEDEENPNKCHASAAWLTYIKPSFISTLLLALMISLLNTLL